MQHRKGSAPDGTRAAGQANGTSRSSSVLKKVAFANIDDAQATTSLLMRYWNSIIADLERESIYLPFVFDTAAGALPG